MKWYNVILATHGIAINKEQAEAWEYLLKKQIPDIKNDELCAVLEEALERDEPLDGYRMTVKDIIGWVHKRRRGWAEESYIIGTTIYFPQRPRICGQVMSQRATEDQIEKHKAAGKYKP